MNSLNDRSFKTAGRQQVGQRAAMSKWINRESRCRCIIQIVGKPLMALNQLIDHCINMHVCLVRHHPAASRNFKSTRTNELLQCSLLGWMRLIPPQLQNTYFRPNERHVCVLLHSRYHMIQDLAWITLEIIQKCFQPTGIVVREWNNNHLQLINSRQKKKIVEKNIRIDFQDNQMRLPSSLASLYFFWIVRTVLRTKHPKILCCATKSVESQIFCIRPMWWCP